MKNIFVIALNTFKETIRDKILYGILGFAILYILLDLFIAKVAQGDMVTIRSFGLAGIYIFGLIITIFLGASIIYKEIEKRTLYFILSRPVPRRDIILGKFCGLFITTLLAISIMSVAYIVVVFSQGGGLDLFGLAAIFFQILEMALFISLLIFLSSAVTPLIATISATLLLFLGHLLESALKSAEQIGGILHKIILVLYYILPNLEKFDIRGLAVYDTLPTWPSAIITIVYALIYIILLLSFANIFFKKREL